MTEHDGHPRRLLTGQVTIDWVDSADPDDVSAATNFGWSIRSEPTLDDERLSILLREISDAI
jgi:hypothetical protein